VIHESTCVVCEVRFTYSAGPGVPRKTCSKVCANKRRNQMRIARNFRATAAFKAVMPAGGRSFAQLWRCDCLHCEEPFDQWGRRGRLRQTCSDECRDARAEWRRGPQRRQWYAELVAAGAHFTLAQTACQGRHAFAAAMSALADAKAAAATQPVAVAGFQRKKRGKLA
jgi:hypothetical protein